MDPAQQVLAALHALYHQDGKEVKDQASKFLEQWQLTVEAWSISDRLLHDPNSSMESQYFGALTLRTKVQRDFEELPAGAVDSLRESLLTLLLKYAKGPPPVRTQLCLALVAMTVHLPAERWMLPPTAPVPAQLAGSGCVCWFAVQLQSRAPAEAALPCLLELLTVLPQEVDSMKYAVRPERRRQHGQELRAATSAAINLLSSCMAPNGGTTAAIAARQQPAVIEAFGAWLRLSEGLALGPDGTHLPSHPLVLVCLEGLRSSGDLFHASVDAVCELIWCTVDRAMGSIDSGMMPLIQVLVPAIMSLRPRFSVATQRALEELHEEDGGAALRSGSLAAAATDDFDDDEHTAKGMARLFAEVGEAYVHLVATAVQEVQAPVEALLDVAAHPDNALSGMSFNFWHKLSRNLSSSLSTRTPVRSESSGSLMDVAAENNTPEGQQAAAEVARRRAFFMPAYERLVNIIRRKVKFPAAYPSWGKDRQQDCRKHRYEMGDPLEDCAAVLGYERTLALLVQPLAELGAAQAAGQPFDWRTAEAALFCVRSIEPLCHDLGPGQPNQLLQLLAALPTMPRTYPLLLNCCCFLISQYSGWLNRALGTGAVPAGLPAAPPQLAEPQAQLLTALLQMAISCIDVPEASGGAAYAIMDLCMRCGPYMGPGLPTLLQLYTSRIHASGVAVHPLPAGALPIEEADVEKVLQGLVVAACKGLASGQLTAAANQLLQPSLAELAAIVQGLPVLAAPVPGGTSVALKARGISAQHPRLCPMLDRLGVLFAHMDSRAVVTGMLNQSWAALDTTFSRCMSDGFVIERACRTLRLAIKGAGPEGAGMLPQLLAHLARRFQVTRHSAFLYILSEMIKIFAAQDEGLASTMSPVLVQMVMEACSSLRSLAQLQADPELVDDTFLLATRALSNNARVLLPAGPNPHLALTTLVDVAMLGVLMQHREACNSVLAFLVRLMDPNLTGVAPGMPEAAQAVLLPRAPMLTRLLMSGVVGVLPSSRLGDVAAVLTQVLRTWGQQALGWLTAVVTALPDVAATQADKEVFLGHAAVLVTQQSGERPNSKAFVNAVDELAELCRRNPRVRQSAQAALLPSELAAAISL